MLSVYQFAAFMGVSPKTVYGWLYRGEPIPHIRIQGTVRFREKEIEAYLKRKEVGSARRNFEPKNA